VGRLLFSTWQQVIFGLNVRPRPGVRVQAEGEWNDVDLAEGRFTSNVYRLITDTQFSPWMFVVSNLQFDTVSKVGWQARFRWTLDPGNDLFFVYTHNWLEDETFDRFATLDRRAAIKFVYTHASERNHRILHANGDVILRSTSELRLGFGVEANRDPCAAIVDRIDPRPPPERHTRRQSGSSSLSAASFGTASGGARRLEGWPKNT
jgi:hypothetical protein